MNQSKKSFDFLSYNILRNNAYIKKNYQSQDKIYLNNIEKEDEIEKEKENINEIYIDKNSNNEQKYNDLYINNNDLCTNSYQNYYILPKQIEYNNFQEKNEKENNIINIEKKNNYYNNEGIFKGRKIENNEEKELQIDNENKDSYKIQEINIKLNNKYLNNNTHKNNKINIENIKDRNCFEKFQKNIINKINNKIYKYKFNKLIKKNNGNIFINKYFNKNTKETNKENEKEFEVNNNKDLMKNNLKEENNKYIENEKNINKDKIINRASPLNFYLNNYKGNNIYKVNTSEKILNKNFNNKNLKNFNNYTKLENYIYNNIGKKAITKLKYKYYKNLNNSQEHKMNEMNETKPKTKFKISDNDRIKSFDLYERRKNQKDIVQEIMNKYKYPVIYKFDTQSERNFSENNVNSKFILSNENNNYQKYINLKKFNNKNKTFTKLNNNTINLTLNSLRSKDFNNYYNSINNSNYNRVFKPNNLSNKNRNKNYKISLSYNVNDNSDNLSYNNISYTPSYQFNNKLNNNLSIQTNFSSNNNDYNLYHTESIPTNIMNDRSNLYMKDSNLNHFMQRKSADIFSPIRLSSIYSQMDNYVPLPDGKYIKKDFYLEDEEIFSNKLKPITFKDLNLMENDIDKINKLYMFGQEAHQYLKRMELRYNILKDEFNQLLNIKNIDRKKNLNLNKNSYENNEYQKDEFKDYLLTENNNLKNENKNCELIIISLIDYINEINSLFNSNKIDIIKIKQIIKDFNNNNDNSSKLKENNNNLFKININTKINSQINNFKNYLNDCKKKIIKNLNKNNNNLKDNLDENNKLKNNKKLINRNECGIDENNINNSKKKIYNCTLYNTMQINKRKKIIMNDDSNTDYIDNNLRDSIKSQNILTNNKENSYIYLNHLNSNIDNKENNSKKKYINNKKKNNRNNTEINIHYRKIKNKNEKNKSIPQYKLKIIPINKKREESCCSMSYKYNRKKNYFNNKINFTFKKKNNKEKNKKNLEENKYDYSENQEFFKTCNI